MEGTHCWCCMVNIEHGYWVKYMTPKTPTQDKAQEGLWAVKTKAGQSKHTHSHIDTKSKQKEKKT